MYRNGVGEGQIPHTYKHVVEFLKEQLQQVSQDGIHCCHDKKYKILYEQRQPSSAWTDREA
jgi:hypothetical protein